MRRLDNLERAWRVIQQNGRTSKSDSVRLELERFGEDAQRNLRSLKGRLSRNSFKFGKAKGVPIGKVDAKGQLTGKIRPIVLAPVESRIVQRAILNVLVEIDPLKPFANTPYSFGGIRSQRAKNAQARKDEISAVPAAIRAVLDEIDAGAKFVASADIRAFFTRIQQDLVLKVIADAIGDDAEFLTFLRSAVTVELDNLAALKGKAAEFPTEEIGVAQGNSLSPLLGNIALSEFDRVMNEGDCRCIRYIDDFIILAPTQKAANARLAKAISLLSVLKMELSPEKSAKGGTSIDDGFDFLGITICPGLIRPSSKAQLRFLTSIAKTFDDSKKAMMGVKNGHAIDRNRSLIATLKRIDGMIDGWGKHYWFCNDGQVLTAMNHRIGEQLASFLGAYNSVKANVPAGKHMQLLGLSQLVTSKGEAFAYPKKARQASS